jgi:hypothetical protein
MLALTACKTHYWLEIIDGGSGATVKRIPINEGETFTVRFIHSVVKAPIFESFYIDRQGKIILNEVKFKKIGVGYGKYIPTLYSLTQRDGWYYMSNLSVSVVLNYRVGFIANHTLLSRGKEYPFSEMVSPGELLNIVPKPIAIQTSLKR